MRPTLKKQLEAFNSSGDILDWESRINHASYNFYDWFCDDPSLENKAFSLFVRLNLISHSKKFNLNKTYVFFQNNCCNNLFDDFRICDWKTDKVLYTVAINFKFGSSYRDVVWGVDNNFDKALIQGDWNDVVNFFNN